MQASRQAYSAPIPESETEKIKEVEYIVYKVGDKTYYVDSKDKVFEMKNGKLEKSNVTMDILTGRRTDETVTKGMLLNAKDDANVRIIAGSLSAAPSKFGVGLTVAAMVNEDEVTSSVGSNGTIDITGGGYDQRATVATDIMVATVAASIASGSNQSTLTAGGAINVVAADNSAKATIGDNTQITAAEDVSIVSGADTDLILISLSFAGGNSKVAVGGTIAVVVDNADAEVIVGENAKVESTEGSVTLESNNHEQLINVLASASAAPPSSSATVAGTIGVLVSATNALVQVKDGAEIKAAKDVNILTDTSSMLVEAAAALSFGGGKAAVGATILVNVLERNADVILGVISDEHKPEDVPETINGVTVTAEEGNVLIQSAGEDLNVVIGLAAAGSSGNAFSGTIPVVVSNNGIHAKVGEKSKVTAGDSIGVITDFDDAIYMFAGGISVASGSVGVGATIGTLVLNNDVASRVAKNAVLNAQMLTGGTGMTTANNREQKRRGVMIEANAHDTIVNAGVAAGVGSTAGVAGTIMTTVVKNTVKAIVETTEYRSNAGTGEESAPAMTTGSTTYPSMQKTIL